MDARKYGMSHIREYECPECGKIFILGDALNWTYKIQPSGRAAKYLCSWTCYNQAKDKTKLPKNKRAIHTRGY